MNKNDVLLEKLGEKIVLEKKIIGEIGSAFNHLRNSHSPEERSMVSAQLNNLIGSLKRTSEITVDYTEKVSLTKSLEKREEEPSQNETTSEPSLIQANAQPNSAQMQPASPDSQNNNLKPIKGPLEMRDDEESGRVEKEGKDGLTSNERLTIKRIKKGGKKEEIKKERRPSSYAKISSKYFYNLSMSFIKKGMFEKLRRNLVKGNLEFVPAVYLSIIFFSTILVAIFSVFLVTFLTFFSVSALPPFISMPEGNILGRLLKFIWIIPFAPGATFLFGYIYPSLEKKSLERKIDHELPFAAIHMSAVSSSMIEPSKMFNIIISTGEYPYLKKEFTKLQNEINIYGYDLVTALKNRSFNSPSKKLGELFNGLATTINSGGNLPIFFEKRAQTLLFEYRIEVEKQGRSAETFMDVYISVVIAAPMVLMLLLMMMRISGLGISLSTSIITITVVTVVSFINILFLGFLQLKGQKN